MFGDFGDGVLLFYPHYPELWKPMNIIMILSRNRYSSTILGCVPMFFHETMKPEVVSNFRPTKNNFNCSTIKKYSWKFSPKLPWKKNRGAVHQEIPHLPGQRRDICRSRPWTLSRSRDLPVPGGLRGPCAKGCLGMPRLQVRMGKHWENIRKH